MPYVRGDKSVEVELSKIQSWVETADPDLYGRNGDPGVIREHRDSIAERRGTMKFVKIAMGVTAFFGSLGGILTVLQIAHIIK